MGIFFWCITVLCYYFFCLYVVCKCWCLVFCGVGGVFLCFCSVV